jgi:hypothetical protein
MPALNTSAFVLYPKSFSTSGATYPGDPHFNLSFTLEFIIVAKPKSAIFVSASLSGLLL